RLELLGAADPFSGSRERALLRAVDVELLAFEHEDVAARDRHRRVAVVDVPWELPYQRLRAAVGVDAQQMLLLATRQLPQPAVAVGALEADRPRPREEAHGRAVDAPDRDARAAGDLLEPARV